SPPQGGAAPVGGARPQPPPGRGDERERALRPGEQVELVSGFGKAIERIAGGILARLGKASRDQPALVGGQMEPLPGTARDSFRRSEEHTSELQSRVDLVCSLL